VAADDDRREGRAMSARLLGVGFIAQLRLLAVERRYRIMTALLLGSAALSTAIYHQRVVTQLPVVVLDLDNSAVSRKLALFLSASREVRVSRRPVSSVGEAEALLQRGEAVALVVIPHDLAANLKRGRRGQVLVAVDMSNVLTSKNAAKAIDKAIGTLGAGVQITTLRKLGTSAREAMGRTVPITVADNFNFNPTTNYVVYLAPAVVFFFLHIYVLILAASLFLRRATIAERLGGAAAQLLVGMALGALLLYALLPAAGIVPRSSPIILLTLLLALVALDLLLAAAVNALIPRPQLAMQAIVLIGMLSLMLSGLTWPTDLFPWSLQRLAALIPFTPFGSGLRVALHDVVSWRELSPVLRQLGVQAALLGGAMLVGALGRRAVVVVRGRA
jgi:ABC-2 type transport system permease protein